MPDLAEFESALRQRKRSSLTIKSYLSSVQTFFSWIKKEPSEVTRQDGDRYIKYLSESRKENGELAGPNQPRTIRTRISGISTFYNMAMYDGIFKANPFHKIALPKIPKHLTALLKSQELNAMLDAPCNTYREMMQRLVLALFWSTGARRAGLANARLSDYDRINSSIKLREKGDKDRYVPLTRRAQYLIESYLTFRRSRNDYLLVMEDGRPVGYNIIYDLLKDLARRTGITSKVYPHKIRHMTATALLEGGADLNTVKEILGHSNIATTSLYLNYSITRIKEQFNKAHPDSMKVNTSKGEHDAENQGRKDYGGTYKVSDGGDNLPERRG